MDAPKRRVYISLPKKYMAAFGENYELDHGVVIKDLNPYLNEGYLQAYFREWGTVTMCKITKEPSSEKANVMAYVRFSVEAEADRADWAGPHFIGGNEVKVRRVVSPKMEEDDADMVTTTAPNRPRPRRSMGLGYIFEDAQWLDDEMDEKKN
ncbi:putative MKI67 FHA domain-interacting nucleolar phosphoprotein-like [Scophthalmus maximus]|uniref:Putative MKI67 FHA domain-interacting nucleolar phosphoprotein-like n=1 Tax=Scophthalmus maximus TaxID=52904 RepID=A0A2U9CQP7_SCOMX|nr:putative MKI67 FHA domain-interacting nucleolar phosphoprotein-like [Scophthalmus maximus]